jgi:hypothetical protein
MQKAKRRLPAGHLILPSAFCLVPLRFFPVAADAARQK